MAFPQWDNLTDFFSKIGEGILKNDEVARAEALKQKNERDKLTIDTLKILPSLKESDEQAQSNAIDRQIKKTELLGLELDNKTKKSDLLNTVLSFLDPGNQKERQDAAGLAKKTRAGVQDYNPADLQKQLQGLPDVTPEPAPTPTPPPATQEPLPAPLSLRQEAGPAPINVPPPPWIDVSGAKASLDEHSKAIRAGIDRRERIFKQQQIVTKSFVQANREYRTNIQKNLDIQRELAMNPPTYRKALSDLHWSQKVVGLLDATFHGHTYKNPMQMIDQMVGRELQAQFLKYKGQMDYLKTERSMYKQFYDINKDDFEAQTSTLAMLYKGVADQVESYGSLVTNAQQKVALDKLNSDIRTKYNLQIATLQESSKQKAFDRFIKLAGHNLKVEEFAHKKKMATTSIVPGAPPGLKPTEAIDRRVKFAGKDYYDIPKGLLDNKEIGVRPLISNSKASYREVGSLEQTEKKITWGAGVKGLLAVLPGTDIGETEKRAFDSLNKGLIKIMLKHRIEFTGGGNMSEKEQEWLREFFEVADSNIWTGMDAGQRLKILKNKESGDYKTLFKLLRKASFFTALSSMEKSPSFNSMTTEEKYKATAKELGVGNKDLLDYLKGDSLIQ